MAVENDADRLALLSDFGVSATIGGETIIGILDNQYEDANGMAVQVPVFTVRMIDISAADRGDAIVVDGVNYTVAEIQDDGQGIGHVVLQKT